MQIKIKTAPPEFLKIVEKILKYINENEERFEHRLKMILGHVYAQSKLVKIKGYCGVFSTPSDLVKRFYTEMNITDQELKIAGAKLVGLEVGKTLKTKTGEKDSTNTMYSDVYYVFLLALIAALLIRARFEKDKTKRKKFIELANVALFLILIKLWNGRLKKYFNISCNPTIMRCVINNKLSEKALAKKFETPMELISRYFVPTLFNKYALEFYKTLDADYLIRLFKQSWNRIDQVFMSSSRKDPNTGEEKRSGLAARYYEAVKKGECRTSDTINTSNDEEDLSVLTMQTSDVMLGELAEKIKHFIMLSEEEIEPQLIKLIRNKSKVGKTTLNKLIEGIKEPDVITILSDVIAIMIRKLKLTEKKNLVCSPTFYVYVDKMITTKNNPEGKHYKELLREIARHIEPRFDNLSNVTQISIMRALNFIVAYYVQKFICEIGTENEF